MNPSGVLEEILETKRAEIESLRLARLPAPPARRAVTLRRDVGDPLRVLAEIKRRSPSAGKLSVRLGVGARAAAYQRAGASMVSVLTDARYFDGAPEHLGEVRNACELPILCKDFVLDEVQLDVARAHGADAVLLIVRCLEPDRLAPLVEAARARDLEPLVEVVNEEEARRAVEAGAELVGVNARDLDTLKMDADRAARVVEGLRPRGAVPIYLSGLSSPNAIAGVARSGAHAALVGEALMRLDDPEPLLREMARAAR